MTKKEILKTGAKLIVSFGVGCIVTNAVAFTTPVLALGLVKRAAIGVGSFVMSSMVSDKAADYTDEKIDEIESAVKEYLNEDEDSKREQDLEGSGS